MKARGLRIAAMLLVAVACAATEPAAASSMHLELTKSSPAEDAQLSAGPAEIRLWFSKAVELSISRIKVTTADGREIELGEVATAEPEVLVAAVHAELAPGTYEVAWRTSSGDGHPITGTFSFTVASTE